MTDKQWSDLLEVIGGNRLDCLPSGFVIDSPWLPNWFGVNILDYYSNDEIWLKANLKAMKDFPDTLFLPGFWSEYGMCTEPSAFGAKPKFKRNDFPHAGKVIHAPADIDNLQVPNPETDGLLPLVLNRLKLAEPAINEAGHKIRFAVARGPLNIASYLMGTTEFLILMMEDPDKVHTLMRIITDFLKSWIDLQMKSFSTIDGIFLLDDIIGFIGEAEFTSFGLPYLKEVYERNVSVKFLHNDAPCEVSAPYLPEIGINLFNMGFEVDLNELKEITGNSITMLGNIPPRDVLASGTPEEVKKTTEELVTSLQDTSRIIFSCGGGMPPGVTSDNIKAFLQGLEKQKV